MRAAKKDQSPACRALTRRDWPQIEKLFGPRGACGGCWCMLWRVPGAKTQWQARLGNRNKRAFRKLVEAGRVHGCLAFVGRDPVGWVSIGPKSEFPYFARSRSIPASTDAREWCVTCFYVPAPWRGKGVASALLAAAVALAEKSGARLIEGYPFVPRDPDARAAAAFAWTGVPRLYEQCEFERATNPIAKKVIYRRRLTA